MGTEVDINVIAENLTELLANSVNMASVFYDIFLNPVPMDVELIQIDADGKPQTLSIPNRAKDLQRARVGEGSPEGNVVGNIGDIYVNLQTQDCYVKVEGEESNVGWQLVFTQQGVATYIATYLKDSGFLNEEGVLELLQENGYTTVSDVANIIANSLNVTVFTQLPSEGEIIVDDNRTYRMTIEGDVHIFLPTITDFSKTHKIYIQANYTSPFYTVDLGTDNFTDRLTPTFPEAGMYDFFYEFDVNEEVWVCGVTPKGTESGISLAARVHNLELLVPPMASPSNPLTDKAYVDDAISSSTASFVGTFESVAALEAYSGPKDNNDYAFVISLDSAGNTLYNRYKYNEEENEWLFEYSLNNSSFTAEQWAAINSGMTSVLAAQVSTNKGDIATLQTDKQDKLVAGENIQINGKTISATDTKYTLPAADASTLGGIKVGSNLTIDASGVLSGTVNPYTLPIATTNVVGGIKVGSNLSVDATGVLSALDSYSLPTASTVTLGGVKVGNNLSIDASGVLSAVDTVYTLPVATTNSVGGIQVGSNLSIDASGVLSALDSYTLPVADTTTLGGIKVGSNLSIDASGVLSALDSYSLPTASTVTLGGVKVGSNLSIDATGVLSTHAPYTLPLATTNSVGGIQVGNNLTISASGVLSALDSYTLPIADTNTLGGIKVGNNLSIDPDGVLNADATSYTLPPATTVSLGGVIVGSNLSVSPTGVLSANPGGITVDATLDTTSTNPIQNKAVANALNDKQNTLVQGVGIIINGNTISASGMSVPIDTVVDSTSANPVENKAIASAIASVADSKTLVTFREWS